MSIIHKSKFIIMKTHLIYLLIAMLSLTFVSCEEGDDSDYYDSTYSSSDNSTSENYEDYGENPFVNVADQPESTFSVDADGGSYSNMRRYVNAGYEPPTSSVRIEEYLNYFRFDYSEPESGENVSLNSEIATCPWNNEHYLMRIGMKGKTLAKSELANSNYVFLIDVSGSMNSSDKLEILKEGFITFLDYMRDYDRVAIVTYAGSSQVLLASTYGEQKETIKEAIESLSSGGSTAGAEGINTAYEIAEANFIPGGNNRVILGTDGDFNVGTSSTDELVELIEEKRESGIYLTVLGVGTGNLNDSMMEQVANKGNGNYEYIDNSDQVVKVFAHDLGKFFTVANDAKINITFNSETIQSYRLIGYENRALENADFENDSVDAGEIGSGQTITALYELILTNNPNKKFAQFDFRYKKPDEDDSRLITHSINGTTVDYASASDNFKFACSVAAFGMIMKGSEYMSDCSLDLVISLAKSATTYDPYGYKSEYISLVESLE